MSGMGDELTRRAEERLGSLLKDKWRLDTLLGVGGMAAVYAATHRNGNHAAIKIIHPEKALDENVRSRFLREGYVANKVGHPGTVAVLDDDADDDGTAFLVMELLDGETLQARLDASSGGLAAEEVLIAADRILDILEAAHDKGIVHRDLKPENVFRLHDGTIKLLDFGIARLREMTGKTGATGSSSSLGTPAFMPPEQARGRWNSVDAQSDVWAVGATMFVLLTKRLVHEAHTVNEHLLAAMTQPAPAIVTVASSVPERVAQIVDKALAFDKERRFASAAEMRAEVRVAYETRAGAPMPEASQVAAATSLPLGPSSVSAEPTFDPRSPTSEPSTTAAGAQSITAGGTSPGVAPPRAKWPLLLAAAAIALGAAGLFALRAPDAPPPPQAIAAPPEVLSAIVASLAASPEDATVTVNGAKAAVHGGTIELSGQPGDVFGVVLAQDGVEKSFSVVMTSSGELQPSSVALPPPAKADLEEEAPAPEKPPLRPPTRPAPAVAKAPISEPEEAAAAPTKPSATAPVKPLDPLGPDRNW